MKNKTNIRLSNAAECTVFSGVRRMFEQAKNYPDAINLTLGEPGFFAPKKAIDAAICGFIQNKTKYTPNAGIRELRAAICEKLKRENGLCFDPDKNIIVTAGATQGLMLAMAALVNPGDEVILQGPNWPDYKGQIDTVGAKAVYATVDAEHEFKMTADVIEPHITKKTKLLIVNSPSNPTGGVLNHRELCEIAELVKKHKIFVISDETYERLVYDGFRQESLGSVKGLDDYLLTVNSLSKTYAMTGFRVGYIAANEHITENLIKMHENMIASIPEPMQMAAVEALRNCDEDVAAMIKYYDENRRLTVDGLNSIKGFDCIMPKGAFYVFPCIKGLGMSSDDAADMILRKAHVVTAPGSAFGPGGEGHIRICYASKRENISQAIERIARVFGYK